MRRIALLGSTGSIGESTLAVLRRHPDRFRLVAITAHSNVELLRRQRAEWRVDYAGLSGPLVDGWELPVGPDVLVHAATHPDVDIVVNAVVGAAGLEATLAALRAGKRVALANKESLVTGGPLVAAAAAAGGGEIVPVDSEHSAVLQCIAGRESALTKLTLTASGGPFRCWDAGDVARATVAQALRHPTWSMGSKITVDSATLANKALELIEAHFLFGLPYDALEAVVHPQSIVHAFAEFSDGSVLAQLGFPSMELPILYALTHPDRVADVGVRRFDAVAIGQLTFEPVRADVFRAFALGVASGRAGGTAPATFNAANEEAVAGFLAGRIAFGRIAETIDAVLQDHEVRPIADVATVRDADATARAAARAAMES